MASIFFCTLCFNLKNPKKLATVFPQIVSAKTILFWSWPYVLLIWHPDSAKDEYFFCFYSSGQLGLSKIIWYEYKITHQTRLIMYPPQPQGPHEAKNQI